MANDDKGSFSVIPGTHAPVLLEVFRERRRQEELWGEQNHPSFAKALDDYNPTPEQRCRRHGIVPPESARELCEVRRDCGNLSWADIFIEEAAEAIGAESTEELREELVQSAAVLVAWIESIDRNEL